MSRKSAERTSSVLVIDPDPIARGMLTELLQNAFVASEADSGPAAIAVASGLQPDVALVADFFRDGTDPRALIRQLHAVAPSCAVVLLGQVTAPGEIVDSIQAGAAGFLNRERDMTFLADVLVSYLRDGIPPMSPIATEVLVREIRDIGLAPPASEDHQLTARETEVLRLMADGVSNAAIAEQLSISRSTVKTHAHNLMAKLGVSRRVELLARPATRRATQGDDSRVVADGSRSE